MTHLQKELALLIKEEIELIDDLISILLEEKNVLSKRQFDALEKTSASKQTLSSELKARASQRITLLCGKNDPSEYKSSLEHYLKNCTSEKALEIAELNQNLQKKLLLCREYNLVNGQIISANLHTRQALIDALNGKDHSQSASVYSRTGNIKSSAQTRRHEEA